MSLQVLNAHTGDKAPADPAVLRSFDEFKAWLSTTTAIQAKNQILLTAAGKQLKFHVLRTEKEIFVYNRKLIAPSTASDTPAISSWSSPARSSLPARPPTVSDQNNISAWYQLFEARRSWARQVADKTRPLAHIVDNHFDAVNTIERGLGVAVDNLQNHVRTLETKLSEAKEWASQAAEDQQDILQSLSNTQSYLGNLPAKPDFHRFLSKLKIPNSTSGRRSSLPEVGTLNMFAQPDEISRSAATISKARQSVDSRLQSLETSVASVSSDATDLIRNVEAIQAESVIDSSNAAWQLMEEIELVVEKINSDVDYISSLPSNSKLIPILTRTASTQDRNYLPPLGEYFNEMMDLVDHVIEQRNAAARRSLSTMQKIAQVESSLALVNSKLMELDMSSDVENAFDYISLLSQLPFVYGALLIEAVRRREWSNRLKDESAALAEDIAEYREEEERRRKKWYKTLSHLISDDANNTSALNFEINLDSGKDDWPEASRNDIDSYLQALRGLEGVDDILDELSEAAKDLDHPTKKQIKIARTFNMGSFVDAQYPKASLILPEIDEVQALKDAKAKLEEELKAQKSRVRKLEDVLHKQSQTSRSNSGNIFPAPDLQPANSPTLEHHSPRFEGLSSRKPSMTSRRSSDRRSSEERGRSRDRYLHNLAADLEEERQRRQALEAEALSKTDDHARIKSEVEESRSTKKDLMENMEAQQREFAEERKLLKGQAKEYKIRLEELEDEMDRVLGSRDNEKVNVEAKLRSLESALSEKTTEMRKYGDMQSEYLKTLHEIRAYLTTDESTHQSVPETLEEIHNLVQISSRQIKDVTQALSSERVEKQELQINIEKQEKELIGAKHTAASLENELAIVKNDYAAEKAKHGSLISELEDGRNQLRTLRAKFAEGETGSEALKLRVEEQANRAGNLATELAEAKSHVNSLDVELSSLQKRHQSLQEEAAANMKRLEQRNAQDRELTNRIVATNEELARLLESVGLSIVYRDGTISIQRTSKIASQSASATTFADSSLVPQADTYNPSPDPELLQWMHASSAEAEDELFKAFWDKIRSFNLHIFSEAIVKLRRDVEWTGKKWKQEARNYRDRYHRAQVESQDKIAYRSFKEGDLALFLPTRNQATRPWAAFNVGAPHYFLREIDAHKLRNREWLVARISRVEERMVDLSKSRSSTAHGGLFSQPGGTYGRADSSRDETDGRGSVDDDDNPFELSDGLRWYLLDAAEEKSGAPATPGLGKSTVASVNVDVKGSIRMRKFEKGNDASGKLNKNLESRRNSTNSKRESISSMPEENGGAIPRNSSATHLRPGSRSSVNNPTSAAGPSGTLHAGNTGLSVESSPQHRQIDEQPRSLQSTHPTSLVSTSTSKPPTPGTFETASKSKAPLTATAPEVYSNSPAKSLKTPRTTQNDQMETSLTLNAEPSPSTRAPTTAQARSNNESPSKSSQNLPKPQPTSNRNTWESLWNLDITSSLEAEPSNSPRKN